MDPPKPSTKPLMKETATGVARDVRALEDVKDGLHEIKASRVVLLLLQGLREGSEHLTVLGQVKPERDRVPQRVVTRILQVLNELHVRLARGHRRAAGL